MYIPIWVLVVIVLVVIVLFQAWELRNRNKPIVYVEQPCSHGYKNWDDCPICNH